MNRFITGKLTLLSLFFFATVTAVDAQALEAVDDFVITGPFQTVRKNIIRNDKIPGDTYSWEFVAATLPEATQGEIVKSGDNIVFKPAKDFHGDLTVKYELVVDGTKDEAEIHINVREYNNPVNIIDPDIDCFAYMQENVPFGVRRKYTTDPEERYGSANKSHNYIDGFTSPLVGDLNGDGKPEIVVMGLHETSGSGALNAIGRYINIYNGQTGDRMYRFDIETLGSGYERMDLTNSTPYFYHRAPSSLALADLDNDGTGEIVMCHTESGRITALKPVFNGSLISGMTQLWEGRTGNNAIVNFKAPQSDASEPVAVFGMPHPYIADLNNDGIPEVIVYNKIFNGATGKLLMSWQSAAPSNSPKYSSLTSANGLSDQNSGTPLDLTTASNIRSKAMTGRRNRSKSYTDQPIAVPAIVNIDNDPEQEIITGSRIHKFKFNSLEDHTQNTYYTIEGPQSVNVQEDKDEGMLTTYNLSDGFTRVADIDGDGKLDIIVATFGRGYDSDWIGSLDCKVVVYVWDMDNPTAVKACVSFRSDGSNGSFSIPFIGDINGKKDGHDGSDWNLKLPEICILGGCMFIDREDNRDNRTGVKFHPRSDENLRRGAGSNLWDNNNTSVSNRRFNRLFNEGHIIGLTWDRTATRIEEKLKLSWAMEHDDSSNSTGITLFDFNNDNFPDLCYRDETTLRVIAPARSKKDYVELGETVSSSSSIMFSTTAYSATGFEYPVIADVNMDGSADIVVTVIRAASVDRTRAWINVYEYNGHKWAPAPPVWNQGMYDPTQIREDLKINARPISMLKTYEKTYDGVKETIRPYNGSWMQVPIVRDNDEFKPVVRYPNAIITGMKVKVNSNTSTSVTLDIFNDGSATIAASAPVYFYDGGSTGQGKELNASTLIGSAQQLGVDIFPNESKPVTFNITGNFNNHLLWACIIVNNNLTPAAGYDDCDVSNNYFSGADCPSFQYTTVASPDTVLCGTTDKVLLTATPAGHTPGSPTYQWSKNYVPISGANSSTYTVTETGTYRCYIIDGICRDYSSPKIITRDTPEAVDDHASVSSGVQTIINVLLNDIRSEYCNPTPEITVHPVKGAAVVDILHGRILYTANALPPNATFDNDELKYKIGNSEATVHIHITSLPDNVISPDCYVEPVTAGWNWAVKETALNSDEPVHNYGPLTVGDIDSDDIIDILGFKQNSSSSTPYPSGGVNIFYFDKTAQKVKLRKSFDFKSTDGSSVSVSTGGSMAIARYDNKGYIVVAGTDKHLYAYDAEGDGTALWRSSAAYTAASEDGTVVGIADFDNDDIPEIYTGNAIFSIKTGAKICDGGSGNSGKLASFGYSSFAANVDGDNKLELCAGTRVYAVNITNSATGSMTPIYEITDSRLTNYKDGATQVADINNDGKLDIIVAAKKSAANNDSVLVYVWTPDGSYNGGAAGDGALTGWYKVKSDDYGIPVIGNIDGDATPEIVFAHGNASNRNITALDYSADGAPMTLKWTISTTSASSSVQGLSLFDFDLDGKSEIVSHYNNALHIIDGSGTAGADFASASGIYPGILRGFPLIADIDDDGHAEIVVTGHNSANQGTNGYLRVFKSGGSPWSSARKVWNQYAYNVVNVHENLTVPATMYNITSPFNGIGVRPFNGFMQQLGYMNDDGTTKLITPDVFCTQGSILTYDASRDFLLLDVHIRNTGDAALQAPFYISTYRNLGGVFLDNMSVDSSSMVLGIGDTKTFLLTIRNFSKYLPLDSVTIVINNRGKAGENFCEGNSFSSACFGQEECNFANNTVTYGYDELLLAHNDRAYTVGVNPVTIGILENDSIPATCSTFEITVLKPPSHGTWVFDNSNNIVYTPEDGYTGVDTVTYQIVCGANSNYTRQSSANIYLMTYFKPDNQSDADCYISPELSAWSIKDVSDIFQHLGNDFSTLQNPLAGDIDGDGKPEILITKPDDHSLSIINGDGTLKRNFVIEDWNYGGIANLNAIGRIKYSESLDTTVIITLSDKTADLYAYDVTGTKLWTSSGKFTASTSNGGVAIQLVDLDGDGWVEILAGNKIYAAESGKLLLTAGTDEGIIHGKDNNHLLRQTVAGDVLGNGKQQLCAGNKIYNITINNRNGTNNNSATVAKSIEPKVYVSSQYELLTITDGATQLADFDLDGNLDIVVSTVSASSLYIYIWSPAKGEIIASKKITNVSKRNVPFIGDIDTDGYPEIVAVHGASSGETLDPSTDKITALKYNPADPELTALWQINSTDKSCSMGITMFDFNQDNTPELVFRDNSELRIIDGSTATAAAAAPLYSIACGSGTGFEYPVVADIDNDGEAEIITAGGSTADATTGPLRVFKAADGHKWAPARKVWNQYSYNAVNVNEDLTVPKLPVNPAIIYAGEDDILGTVDDERPFNNFLQQQTLINKKGQAIWLSPNAVIVEDPQFKNDVLADSVSIDVVVTNSGNATFTAPFYITLYKDEVSASNLHYIHAHNEAIPAGDTVTISLGIGKFQESGWEPFSKLIIRVNDKGNTYSDQMVCDSAYISFETNAIIGVDDRVIVVKNSSDNKITVTINDLKPCAEPKIEILTEGLSGQNPNFKVELINDSIIVYTPEQDYLGNDTITYRIYCDENDPINIDEATLYISVMELPDNVIVADCYTNPPATQWSIRETTINKSDLVHNFGPLTVGDIDGNDTVEIIGFIPSSSGYEHDYESAGVRIFYFDKDEQMIKFKKDITFSGDNVATFGDMAIARYNNVGYIVVSGINKDNNGHHLYAYNAETGELAWKSPETYYSLSGHYGSIVSIADFDGNGVPEVYTGNSIFSLTGGTRLVYGGANRNRGQLYKYSGSMSFAANIVGDGNLELCAGDTIYSVDVNTSTITAVKSLSEALPQHAHHDGATMVADINNDGQLDVIVVSKQPTTSGVGQNNQTVVYVWTPDQNSTGGSLIGHFTAPSSEYYGIPMIGNIDDTPEPEIVFVGTGSHIYALKYDGTRTAGDQIVQKWTFGITDASSCTGMSLFDFNLDGKNEIVYRDPTHLRIIDGSGTVATPKTTFYNVLSGTLREFPVVADIDGDGQAEIVVTGHDATTDAQTGYVRVFKSNGSPWASARKVWNQYAYNAVNVNEDLTIPSTPFNPAMAFPGNDGLLGTADDIRPYNNFMQQQTMLSQTGTPVWLISDAKFAGTPAPVFVYAGDSLVISLQAENIGDAGLQLPFYLSAYRNTRTPAARMAVDSSMVSLNAGEKRTVSITIRELSKYMPLDEIIVAINDTSVYVQPECDYNNNTIAVPFENLLLAHNDTATTVSTTPVKIDALKNDSVPDVCSSPVIATASAKYGAATIVDDSIRYQAAAEFVGYDTVTYRIECNGNTSTAKVFIIVYNKPDNIVDESDCKLPMPVFDFTIQRQIKNDGADAFSGAIAGDLDGDGIPEIAVPRYGTTNYRTIGVHIYNGATLEKKQYIPFNSNSYYEANAQPTVHAPMVMVNTKGGDKRDLIICHPNGVIESFTCTVGGENLTLSHQWAKNFPTTGDYANYKSYVPHVADFNADGIPELLVYNRIYNAATGELLLELESPIDAFIGRDPLAKYIIQKYVPVQAIADLDHDGILEIAAGSKVYKPIITNSVNSTGNTVKIIQHPSLNKDGRTAIADINSDGILDIIFVAHRTADSKELDVKCWNLNNSSVIEGTVTAISSHSASGYAHGYLFIGDIDGIKNSTTGKYYPEICLNSIYLLSALKYNPSTNLLETKWTLSTSDESGCTGITLYDFNNDGISELVYRDQTLLRIIDGSGTSATNLESFSCFSATALEMPIIIDAQGVGNANILITGYENNIANNYIYMFSSKSSLWTPARTVWNQTFYEPLLINEDLTTVRYPMPKTTVFNNPDRPMPYNNVLQQQPIVNDSHEVVIFASDPAVDAVWVEEVNAANSKICVRIENRGVKNTNPTLPVAFYKGTITLDTPAGGANYVGKKSVDAAIQPGEKYTLCFEISNANLATQMSVRIQDDGDKFLAEGSYLDCDSTNNVGTGGSLLAVRDYVIDNTTSATVFNVLDNDYFGICGKNSLTAFDTVANSGLKNGSLTIDPADGSFTYTPTLSNFLGVDSLTYHIKCDADSSAAKVYILVQRPLSQKYVACEGASVTIGFAPITDVQYYWYDAETGGNILNGGNPSDVLTVTKGSADVETWWVEARAGNITFPRYPVELELGDCGVTDPQGCAKDGTVLFKEDFGGNATSDPMYKPEGISDKMSGYTYDIQPTTPAYNYNNAPFLDAKEYMIAKKGEPHHNTYPSGTWEEIADHTYPDTYDRGYFLEVNAANEKGQFYAHQIDGLCEGFTLYFSAWINNVLKSSSYEHDVNQIFILEDLEGNIIAQYYTGDIENGEVGWKQYGFRFTVPDNMSSIILRIINNGKGSSGNDFALDDIEIRLCTPPITMSIADTVVCTGTLDIVNTYIEDCTFGDELSYRFEFRHIDSDIWTPLASGTETVDCKSVTESNRTLQVPWTIQSVNSSHEGYYRMIVSSPTHIGNVNCRAMSDSVYVKVAGAGKPADIRVDICPSPSRAIRLSSFLDTVAYNTLSWTKIQTGAPDINSATGEINTAGITGLSKYKYSMTSKCGTGTAIAYVYPLKNRLLRHVDTIAICKDEERSRNIHINSILGLDVNGGTWVYDNSVNPDNTVESNVKTYPSTSSYYGALIFDAYQAWHDATDTDYSIDYRGDTGAKKFVFRYTATDSCFGNVDKEIVIVVTETM